MGRSRPAPGGGLTGLWPAVDTDFFAGDLNDCFFRAGAEPRLTGFACVDWLNVAAESRAIQPPCPLQRDGGMSGRGERPGNPTVARERHRSGKLRAAIQVHGRHRYSILQQGLHFRCGERFLGLSQCTTGRKRYDERRDNDADSHGVIPTPAALDCEPAAAIVAECTVRDNGIAKFK